MPAVDVATVFGAHALTPAADVTTLDQSLQRTKEIYDRSVMVCATFLAGVATVTRLTYSTTSTLRAPTIVIG